MRYVLLLPAIACLLSASIVKGQRSYYFKHYEVEHGLSNNNVLTSIQDKKGFMWFGTIDGLNRFDGYNFKTFRHDRDNLKSIGTNAVFSLYPDEDEIIWVGTNNGLYKYDAVEEKFELIKATDNQRVRSICKDDKGFIWFVFNDTLCGYHTETKKIRSYDFQHAQVTSVCTDYNGSLWVSTSTGLLEKYDPLRDAFVSYDVFAKSKNPGSRFIEKIYDTKKGSLLVGIVKESIKLFDIASGTYKDLNIYNHNKTEIITKDFMQYSENEYWIATEHGIYIYDITNENISSLHMEYNNVYSISDNSINTLWKDKEGGVWAGTRFGGISYYPFPYISFEKYFSQNGKSSLMGNGVHEICPDTKGNLWIGTEDAGLNKLDLKTGVFKHFAPDGKKGSISYSNIHGLLLVDNELWIGTYQYGLDRMDLRTEKVVKHYTAGKNSFSNNFIVHLYKTKEGQIFVGTWEGLYRYNKPTDDFAPVPGFGFQTQSILEDEKGLLWICTMGNGVFTYDQKTGAITNHRHDPDNPNSLGNNMVNGQYMDSRQNLWFATDGGLCKYDPREKKFRTYTVKDGMPSNFMFKILEEEGNRLWVTSTKGLILFDPQTEAIKVYTTANGLLNDQFNWNSAYKDPNGRMYFGSVKGMISFIPDKFSMNRTIPPVYLTGIQVYNKEIPIKSKSSPLKKSITYTPSVTLRHNQSTISIDFAALSYISPETNEYAYKMEGLENNWTYLKANRKVYFTELLPGDYVFKVKASNSSGIWNEKETTLTIKILPPFWASRWAFLFYVVAVLVAVYLIARNYHNRIIEKNKRKIELLEHEKEKEIYQSKIDFFTNVAHEIRTPLTLIRGPMEKIMNKVNEVPEIKNSLVIMEKNTNRLLQLTNQLLDFRQTEVKGFALNFASVNISELLRDMHESFRSIAEQKRLRYHLHLPAADFFAQADSDALNKILSNLYSNAVKYGDHKLLVTLFEPRQGADHYTIMVKNDGFLIPYEMRDKIFEPFFRMQETKMLKGTGIGLALSRSLAELHKGRLELQQPDHGMNIFMLTLPVISERKPDPLLKTEEELPVNTFN